jgi:serine/threonine protein kinase
MGCILSFLQMENCQPCDIQLKNNYSIKSTIYSGPRSCVFVGYDKVCRKDVVLKCYTSSGAILEGQRELKNLLKLSHHENIVSLHDFSDNSGFVCLILNVCPGEWKDLFDFIVSCPGSKGPKLKESYVRKLLNQVVSALDFMKKKALMAHGDISPENILVDVNTFQAKLIDFGSALTSLEDTERVRPQRGKLSYMSPELFFKRPENIFASDVWSLGVTAYCAIKGFHPYNVEDLESEYHFRELVCRAPFELDDGNISEDLVDNVASMLNLCSKDRPTVQTMVEKKWFT